MSKILQNPGDVLEGSGALLEHGRLIANVEYHLTVPTRTHFLVNPTGKLRNDYADHVGGFILLAPADARQIELTAYTLELADKSKKTIRVERRYKQLKFKGKPRVSFWIKVLPAG